MATSAVCPKCQKTFTLPHSIDKCLSHKCEGVVLTLQRDYVKETLTAKNKWIEKLLTALKQADSILVSNGIKPPDSFKLALDFPDFETLDSPDPETCQESGIGKQGFA